MTKNRNINLSLVELQGGIEKSDEDFAYIRGIASSTSLNSKFFSISAQVQRVLRQQFNDEDIPIFQNHFSYGYRSGEVLRAWIRDDKTHIEGRILSGLEKLATDDLIRMLEKSLIKSLSIGFAFRYDGGPDDTKLICDVCEEEMTLKDNGWFYYLIDENGHYPGKLVKEKGKSFRVTATINGGLTLRELSVVDQGADPEAKILSELENELKAQSYGADALEGIAEINNFNLSYICQQLGVDTYTPQLLDTQGRHLKMSKPLERANEQLQQENDALEQENSDLKDKISSLEERLDSTYSDEEIQGLKDKITELEESKPETDKILAAGTSALKRERSAYINSYKELRKAQGDPAADDDTELLQIIEEAEESSNLSELRAGVISFKKTMRRSVSGRKSKSSDSDEDYIPANESPKPANYRLSGV